MRHVLTRQQLYDLVWERPLSKLGPEFGVSDVALRKQCTKHAIPVPDARYRGLVNAGRPARRAALPKAPAGVSERVEIWGSDQDCLPAEVEEVIAGARAREIPAAVPERLHPLVASTMAAARRAKIDRNGGLTGLGPEHLQVRLHPDQLERAGSFLNLLVRSSLALGHEFAPGREGVDCVVGGEHIPFLLNQTIRRTRHVATEEERERQRRWDASNRGSWRDLDGRPEIPWWDFTATGELSLEIRAWGSGDAGTKRFADSRTRKLEERVPDILVAFAAHAAGFGVMRREAEERARKAEAERLHVAELARLAKLEEQRSAFARRKLEQIDARDGYRRLLAELGGALDEREPASRNFLRWCRAGLAVAEDRLSGSSVARELERMAAFLEPPDE